MGVSLTQFQDNLPQSDDFLRIVLQRTPLIDVRAPVEFAQGAFEMASNLPLMDDEQRRKVGVCYKQHGNAAAVRLGHQLVNASVREPRIQAWQDFMQTHPNAMLYCFRGGMRSKIAQQWLADAGCEVARLKGGYKAFRRFLIDFLDQAPALLQQQSIQPLVLAGRTGAGKTQVIQQLPQALDLEALAHHRGSAFGRHATPQPSQIDFENALAMALIRLVHTRPSQLVIEDEARNIGSVALPKPLFDALKAGPRIIVETPLAERIQITHDEYVVQSQQEYPTLEAWMDFMRAALERIRKRLGGERHQRVVAQFEQACSVQLASGDQGAHQSWIETLLCEYYDPMYDYQMQKNQHRVRFRGTRDEVIAYLRHASAS
jgi:tRNA 2-selenouridine synthase